METGEIKQNDKALYIKAFTAMILSRTLDKKIMTAQRQGRVGFYTPTMGQEATQVGLSMALKESDFLYGYYRDVPMLIHRGAPMEVVINQIMGNSSDAAMGRQMPSHFLYKEGNFFTVPSPVGTNLPLAVGTAYAYKFRKEPKVVVGTFGEGASSTPDFHASMNLASVFKVPLIFVCENNGWAISLPVEKQTKVEISQKAAAYGMKGIKGDGNNFIEMYRASLEAIENARKGEGPTLIDAISYRMGPHSTSDDPTKYRENEITEGSDRDPIVVAENILRSQKVLDDKLTEKIKTEAQKIVDAKFDECEKIPMPDPENSFRGVYSKDTWMLEEEVGDIL